MRMQSIRAGKKLDMEADKWLHVNNCNGSYTLSVSNKKNQTLCRAKLQGSKPTESNLFDVHICKNK